MKNAKIALLPNPDSQAFWFLTEFKDKLDVLSWSEVAEGKLDAEKYDLLFYCLGENYVPSVKTDGDVDKAILNYLSQGGFLTALPSGPIPFYYDDKGRAVNNANKFGFNLKMGWENPPQSLTFKFVQPDSKLKHLPKSFSFPKSGDLRWRPIYRDSIYKSYRALIELRDDKDNFYGDALAIAELKTGGKVAYCWFGLPNTNKSEELLYDLLESLVDESKHD